MKPRNKKYPDSADEALRVLRREVEMRQSKDFIKVIKSYIDRNQLPPLAIYDRLQFSALAWEGFDVDYSVLEYYRYVVRAMSYEEREEIYFLRVNDR